MTRDYQRIDLAEGDPLVTQTAADTEYHRNGMCFRTDAYGRTVEIIIDDLDYHDAERRQLPRQLTGSEPTTIDPDGETIVTEGYTSNDLRNNPRLYYADGTEILSTQNGHIVASHFGGPPDAFNIVPQSVLSNLSTYKRDVENPIDKTIDAHPDIQLSGRYRTTYSNDVDAPDFYVPRDISVDTYIADAVVDGNYDDVEPISSFSHRHYYDRDLHDVEDDDYDPIF